MNARSGLGHALQLCSIFDSQTTYNTIMHLMETIPSSPNVSIVLLASASFVFSYLSFDQRAAMGGLLVAPLLRHAIFANQDHLSALTQYLKEGGNKKLPLPDLFLSQLLLKIDIKVLTVTKPISIIISADIKGLSPIFWEFIERNDMNIDLILFISNVIRYCNLTIPKSEKLINSIKETCNEINETFSFIEAKLVIYRWLIANKGADPFEIKFEFSNPSLNALAIDCWAEYASYGDFSKFPEFPISDSTPIQRTYLKLIANASKNPNFTYNSFYVPHWIWEQILFEFTDFTPKLCFKSLYSLSPDELKYSLEFAHILPSSFFIHALRFKSKNHEIASLVIDIVSFLPHQILETNYDDFLSFIDNQLEFPSNADNLADCLRALIIHIMPKLDSIVEHILESIDYFDESSLVSRLTLLNTLFCFSVDVGYFLDVYDAIWESYSFNKTSLHLFEVIIQFFINVAPFIDDTQKLIDLATTIISELFEKSIPSFLASSEHCALTFNSCHQFKRVNSSDIVIHPLFNAKKSFPLLPLSLCLLKRLSPSKSKLNYQYVLTHSLILIPYAPVEMLAFVSKHFKHFISINLKREVQFFCKCLEHESQRNNDITFVLLELTFREQVQHLFPLNIGDITTNISTFTDNVYETRVSLEANDVLISNLLMKVDQLNVLLELWTPNADTTFLDAVLAKIPFIETWYELRCCIEFLTFFKYKLPEIKLISCWINKTTVKFDNTLPELDEQTKLSDFQQFYPVEKKDNEVDTLTDVIRTYHETVKCQKFIAKLTENNLDKLFKPLSNKLWFLRFMKQCHFQIVFDEPPNNRKCLAFALRLHLTTSPHKFKEDWLRVEQIRNYQIEELEAKNLSPNMLNAIFISKMKLLPLKELKELMKYPYSSIHDAILMNIITFLNRASKNEILEFINNHSSAIYNFLSSLDITNPPLFEYYFVFITTYCKMLGDQSLPKIPNLFLSTIIDKCGLSAASFSVVFPTIKDIFQHGKMTQSFENKILQFIEDYNSI